MKGVSLKKGLLPLPHLESCPHSSQPHTCTGSGAPGRRCREAKVGPQHRECLKSGQGWSPWGLGVEQRFGLRASLGRESDGERKGGSGVGKALRRFFTEKG